MDRIAILGAGMAGFGAAHRLRQEGVDAVVFDQNDYIGGHTVSYAFDDGFVFDDGPHISFTKDDRIRDLFAESCGAHIESHAVVNNHWKGHWIKHPAQCNLHGLPTDLLVDVLRDFVEAGRTEPDEIANYEEWLLASYGETFARTFPMEYTVKYHTTEAKNLNTDWLGPRLYRPELEQVFRGLLEPDTDDVHYITTFRYPKEGGFVSYLDGFKDDAEVRLGHRLVRLDPEARELHFENGAVEAYDHVVSSIPLPELIPMIDGVPEEVVEAAGRLACSQCVIVNVGLGREDVSEAHWTYIYDRDLHITRLSFPHKFSPHTCPPGCGSIQAEVYFSDKYRPFTGTAEDLIGPVLDDLRSIGLVREDDEVLHTSAWFIPYANVIFDLDTAPATATVHAYLDEIGVRYAGRYGDWAYIWTDEAFKSGERAAQRVLADLGGHELPLSPAAQAA